jgi:carbon-monoxide dehydrogenase small subunit
MTLGFLLNGEDVVVKTDADRRLIDILRNHFKLLGAKQGCLNGVCGSCSIIFNSKVVPSCLIPAFRIRGSEIITIEGFSKYDEYQDIKEGFAQAGVVTCGYCDAGKILTVETLLGRNMRPTRDEILAAFKGIKCRCTEPESLIAGVLATADIRQRRLYGRSA